MKRRRKRGRVQEENLKLEKDEIKHEKKKRQTKEYTKDKKLSHSPSRIKRHEGFNVLASRWYRQDVPFLSHLDDLHLVVAVLNSHDLWLGHIELVLADALGVRELADV